MAFVISSRLRLLPPKQSEINAVYAKIKQGLRGNINVGVTIPKEAVKNIRDVEAGLKRLESASRRNNTHLGKSVSLMEDFADKTKLAFKRYSAFVVGTNIFLRLADALGKSVGKSFELQRELNKIAQVTDSSIDSTKALKQQIIELSQAYGISSLELAKSARLLRQAGLDAKKTEAAMRVLAKTNLAPNFKDVETTTDDMIAIFKQFNLQAHQLESAFDAINYVASKYAIDAADVGEAVKKSGAAFKSAGGSLEEYIATVTVIRDRTRESANVVGTSIKTIVSRLQNANIQNLLRSEGIQLVNPKGDFIGPLNAFKAIGEELRGVNQQSTRFSKIVNAIGGLRQVSRVIPLLTNPDEFAKIEDIIKNSSGSLAKDVELALKTVSVAINRTKESFDAFIDGITSNRALNSLLTTILDITTAVLKLANAISTFPVLGETVVSTLSLLAGAKILSKGLQFTKYLFKNEGGLIPGRGPNKDTVPAMLTKGEYVMNRKAVDTYGPAFFAALNYNRGGIVGLNTGGDPVKNYAQSGYTNDDYDIIAPSLYEDLHKASVELNKLGAQHLETVKIVERVSRAYRDAAEAAGQAAIAQLDAQKIQALKDPRLKGPELYPDSERAARKKERFFLSNKLQRDAERSAKKGLGEINPPLPSLGNIGGLKPLPGPTPQIGVVRKNGKKFIPSDSPLVSPDTSFNLAGNGPFTKVDFGERIVRGQKGYQLDQGNIGKNGFYIDNSFSSRGTSGVQFSKYSSNPEYRSPSGPSFSEIRAHSYALKQTSTAGPTITRPGEALAEAFGPAKPTAAIKRSDNFVKALEVGKGFGLKTFDILKSNLPFIASVLTAISYNTAQGYQQEGINAIKENRGISFDTVDGKVVGKTGRITQDDTNKAILGGVAKKTIGYTSAGASIGAGIGGVIGGIGGFFGGGGVGAIPGAAGGAALGGKIGAGAGAVFSGLTEYDGFNQVLKDMSFGLIDITSSISETEKELEETRKLYAQEVQSVYEELQRQERNAAKQAALDSKNFAYMNRIIDLNAKFAEATAVSIAAFDEAGAYTSGNVTANRNADLLSRASTGNIQTTELRKLYGLVGAPEDRFFGVTDGTSTLGGGAATEATFIKAIPTALSKVLKSDQLGNVESATDTFSKALDSQFKQFVGFVPQSDQYNVIKDRFVQEFSGFVSSGQTAEGSNVFGPGQAVEAQKRLQSASTDFIKSFELMHRTMENFNDGLISLYDQRREVENQYIQSINDISQFQVGTITKLKEFRGDKSSNIGLYRSENLLARSNAASGIGFTPNSFSDIRSVGAEIRLNQSRLQNEQYKANAGQVRDAVTISGFKDAVNNGTRALKALADSSTYLSQIEEEIGRERARREQVGALAERTAFGTREDKRELDKNARNTARAAQYGLSSVRREDRGGVLDYINSLSEVQSADFGTDAAGNVLTGQQLKDRLIKQETGFNNTPQGREKNLIKEYERIANLSAAAQKELADVSNTQVQISQAISQAINNFNNVMSQTNWTQLAENMKNFPSHITGQFKHDVNVTFNGTSAFKDMEASMEKLAVGTFKREFNRYITENLPEYPTV